MEQVDAVVVGAGVVGIAGVTRDADRTPDPDFVSRSRDGGG
jgi:L-2-hydroxyglutarate oxidase LhgO